MRRWLFLVLSFFVGLGVFLLAACSSKKAESRDPAPYRPSMLAHPLEEEDFGKLDPAEFMAEWKWDGIRLQAVAGPAPDGRRARRLYSRTGEDVSGAFPDRVVPGRQPVMSFTRTAGN